MKARVTIVLTSPRAVTGTLEVGNARLSDALNNRLESVFHLKDARIGRLANLAAAEPHADVVVPKSAVAVVFGEEDAPPPDRRLYAFVEKRRAELVVLVAGLRLRGEAHATSELDPANLHRLITTREDRFLPLTRAVLSLDVEGTRTRDLGVAHVNARHIEFAARPEGAPVPAPLRHAAPSRVQGTDPEPELPSLDQRDLA